VLPRKDFNSDLPAPTQTYEPPTILKDTYELPLFKKDSYEAPTYQKDTYEPSNSTFKYQTGAVVGTAHPSPKLKQGRLEKAKQRVVVGESQSFTKPFIKEVVGESQSFSQPYNNYNYEPKKSLGSKMETYQKDPVVGNSINMKDDFFDKMMQDNNMN
jgi:hypothetical protein